MKMMISFHLEVIEKYLKVNGQMIVIATCMVVEDVIVGFVADTNRIYDGVEAETRKSEASFQIIQVSSEALPNNLKTSLRFPLLYFSPVNSCQKFSM